MGDPAIRPSPPTPADPAIVPSKPVTFSAPPEAEPPLTAPAAEANEFATYDEEKLAEKLHDADARFPTPWEKVDPVYRERRIAQAHDLITLGFVQAINEYFGRVNLNLAP